MTALASILAAAAIVVAALGVVAGTLVFVAARDLRAAAGAALDLWMGAGLLHLAASSSFSSIAISGAIIAVRKLAMARR